MTPEEIGARVLAIIDDDGDNEEMHIAEDELVADVLRAISDGTADDAQECARAALVAVDLNYTRWYA